MSGLGEELQEIAAENIEEYGEVIKLVRVTPAATDPITGEPVPGATETRVEHECFGIVGKASGGVIQAFGNRFENGTLIETHLRTVVVAALGLAFEPMPGDKAVFDSHEWTALGSTPERAEGLNVTFSLTVKR